MERLLAHNYADWFFCIFGIGGGTLRYEGCLLRLLGERLSAYVRRGRHREGFWGVLGGFGQAQAVSVNDEW